MTKIEVELPEKLHSLALKLCEKFNLNLNALIVDALESEFEAEADCGFENYVGSIVDEMHTVFKEAQA